MIIPIERPFMSSSDDGLPELPLTDEEQQWQMSFHEMEQWICQLLMKNQQLRMALMEMKSRQPVNAEGHDSLELC